MLIFPPSLQYHQGLRHVTSWLCWLRHTSSSASTPIGVIIVRQRTLGDTPKHGTPRRGAYPRRAVIEGAPMHTRPGERVEDHRGHISFQRDRRCITYFIHFTCCQAAWPEVAENVEAISLIARERVSLSHQRSANVFRLEIICFEYCSSSGVWT